MSEHTRGVPDQTLTLKEVPVVLQGVSHLGVLALLDAAGNVRFIDPVKGRMMGGVTLKTLITSTLEVADIAFKGHLYAFGDDTSIGLVHVKSRKILYRLEGHRTPISCITFDPKSRFVLSGSDDGMVIGWDVTTGRRSFNAPAHTDGVLAITMDADATWIATGGFDRTILLSRYPHADVKRLHAHKGAVTALCFVGKNGLVSGDRDGALICWNLKAVYSPKRFPPLHQPIVALCHDTVSGLLFVGTASGTIALYDVISLRLITKEFTALSTTITGMHYVHDAQCLAVATEDKRLLLIAVFDDVQALQNALEYRDYEALEAAAMQNPAVEFSDAFQGMQMAWEETVVAIEQCIATQRVPDVEGLLAPFSGVRHRQQDVAGIRTQLKQYALFEQHVTEGRYAMAYHLATIAPLLKHSPAYIGMEQEWQQVQERAKVLLYDPRGEEEAQELLARYRGISQKRPVIQALLEEGRLYRLFSDLIGRQEWKRASEILRHHDQLRGSDAYKRYCDHGDKLFISAQKAYSAKDFSSVRTYCNKLLNFPDFKVDAQELLEAIKEG